MKIAQLLFLLQFFSLSMKSQTTIQGEYNFHRQEMVAGFDFLPEGKFNFFFSYGAFDRTATATFLVKEDTIKLKSSKEAGKDFTISHQVKTGTGYSIKFINDNKYLLTNIRCSFFIGTDKSREILVLSFQMGVIILASFVLYTLKYTAGKKQYK